MLQCMREPYQAEELDEYSVYTFRRQSVRTDYLFLYLFNYVLWLLFFPICEYRRFAYGDRIVLSLIGGPKSHVFISSSSQIREDVCIEIESRLSEHGPQSTKCSIDLSSVVPRSHWFSPVVVNIDRVKGLCLMRVYGPR